MDFQELEYIPTDYTKLQNEINDITIKVQNAKTSSELFDQFERLNQITEEQQTAYHLAMIRSYTDVNDTFYSDAFHAESEGLNALNSTQMYGSFLSSPFFAALSSRYGKQLELRFRNRMLRSSVDPALLNTNRRLVMDFHKLRADMRIQYDNKLQTESEMYTYFSNPSRDVRISCRRALSEAFYAERGRFSAILHELVRVRNGMAQVAGFDNYLEYRNFYYERMGYGEQELTALCQNIQTHITPVYKEIQNYQSQMLGIEKVMMYDTSIFFADGDAAIPTHCKSLSDAVQHVLSYYSPVLTNFFDKMQSSGYIDIRPSKKKVSGTTFTTDIITPGGYPFIFGNLKNISKSFNIVNCGIGTAYASYLIGQKSFPVILRKMVTDAMEIPAKVLELISADYAEELCGSEADKYRYELFCRKIREIVCFCSYHETETFLYTHPDASFSEIADELYRINAGYDPGHDEGVLQDSHVKETNLMRTISIYAYPRYSISLVLAQISAFQMYDHIRRDSVFGWKDFDTLCSLGGSRDYMDCLASVGLPTPFAPRTVEHVAEFAKAELQKLRSKI